MRRPLFLIVLLSLSTTVLAQDNTSHEETDTRSQDDLLFETYSALTLDLEMNMRCLTCPRTPSLERTTLQDRIRLAFDRKLDAEKRMEHLKFIMAHPDALKKFKPLTRDLAQNLGDSLNAGNTRFLALCGSVQNDVPEALGKIGNLAWSEVPKILAAH